MHFGSAVRNLCLLQRLSCLHINQPRIFRALLQRTPHTSYSMFTPRTRPLSQNQTLTGIVSIDLHLMS